jgi:hypothetical protein
MNEQDEAKTFHAAQAFTNMVFHFTLSAQWAMRTKHGREQADAFYDALIHAIETARNIGRDEDIKPQSPFTMVESEVLTLHAALYAFNQFSPLLREEMEELCTGALECAIKVVTERAAEGIHTKIAPVFHLSKGDNGELLMGVSIKDEIAKD